MTDQIKALIAEGETEKAIQLLLDFSKTKSKAYQHKAHLISSQYRRWKKEELLGINHHNQHELRRIELRLVELVDFEDEKTLPAAAGRAGAKNLFYLIVALVVAAIVVAIYFFAFNGTKTGLEGELVTSENEGDSVPAASIVKPTDTPQVANVEINKPDLSPPSQQAHFGPKKEWLRAVMASFSWQNKDCLFAVGDVDKDNKDDLIIFKNDGVHVARATGTGFVPPKKWSDQLGHGPDWHKEEDVRAVGDADGDGKADIIGINRKGVSVMKSTGSGFAPPQQWSTNFSAEAGWYGCDYCPHYLRTVADVNGDGKMDLVGFSLHDVYVSASTGSRFGEAKSYLKGLIVGLGGWEKRHLRTLADVNGDGRADAIGFGNRVYVALEARGDFQNVAAWGTELCENPDTEKWNKTDHDRSMADINGDGKADIIGFNDAGVHVCLSNGSGFDKAELWLENFAGKNAVRMTGDFNGDGKADLLEIIDDHAYVALSR